MHILRNAARVALGVAALAFASCDGPKQPKVTSRQSDVPALGFRQLHPEPAFTGLVMVGKVGTSGVSSELGALIRTLRFRDIAYAVDGRYGLPEGTLLGMVAQETNGADLLPNVTDGGAGLCHMQPYTASRYGLKIYQDCTELSSRAHGEALSKLIAAQGFDRRRLVAFDSRFHPVINLDCAGRILHDAMLDYARKPRSGYDPYQWALRVYSGRATSDYFAKVQRWRQKLADPAKIAAAAEAFEKASPNFAVNGKPAGFDLYLQVNYQQNENYGLAEYAKLAISHPPDAEKMRARWDRRYR